MYSILLMIYSMIQSPLKSMERMPFTLQEFGSDHYKLLTYRSL